MTAPARTTLVTIAVAGPFDGWWWWDVDGPGGLQHGRKRTEAEAWAAARTAAVTVLGRLEVPGGGDQLRRTIAGEGP